VRQGGHFVVRTTWHHAPLEDAGGGPFDLFAALRKLKGKQVGDFDARVAADERHGFAAVPCRVVAVRKPAEAAQEAKSRILAEAKKKHATVDPRTLEACEYFFVLTSLSRGDFAAESVLVLYRLRWQIEVEFKRLKSLLHLDDLRAMTPASIRAALAAKLLGAVLVEELATAGGSGEQHWNLTQLLYDSARQAILGPHAALRWLTDRTTRANCPLPGHRQRSLQCGTVQARFA
jgi:hypothetical protein